MTIPSLDASGKVVVVTGGSKGLGRAMALGFAEAGADVVVASRNRDMCEDVAGEVRSMGRRAFQHWVILASSTSARAMARCTPSKPLPALQIAHGLNSSATPNIAEAWSRR